MYKPVDAIEVRVWGMGALEFKPARGPSAKKSTALVLANLIEEARRAVHGELGSGDLAKAALAQIIKVGTSAAALGISRNTVLKYAR